MIAGDDDDGIVQLTVHLQQSERLAQLPVEALHLVVIVGDIMPHDLMFGEAAGQLDLADVDAAS